MPIPRFHFSLRTLIALVTLVAVTAWIYSVGWPWGKAYYEQLQFEQIARSLQAGVTRADVRTRVGREDLGSTKFFNNPNTLRSLGALRYTRGNAVYFVCFEYPPDYISSMSSAPSTRVEIYRLPRPPREYRSRTISTSTANIREAIRKGTDSADQALDDYTLDFHHYYIGDRQDTFGLEIERLHVDPPPAKAP